MSKEIVVRQAENGVIVYSRTDVGRHIEDGPERVYETIERFFKYMAGTLVFADSIPTSLVEEKEK